MGPQYQCITSTQSIGVKHSNTTDNIFLPTRTMCYVVFCVDSADQANCYNHPYTAYSVWTIDRINEVFNFFVWCLLEASIHVKSEKLKI